MCVHGEYSLYAHWCLHYQGFLSAIEPIHYWSIAPKNACSFFFIKKLVACMGCGVLYTYEMKDITIHLRMCDYSKEPYMIAKDLECGARC